MSLMLMALLLPAAPLPAEAKPPAPAAAQKTCRDLLLSSSRLGAVRVCKTRAAWERWEKCHSATRYCDPPRQSTLTVAALPGDPLVCKYLKTTGSRLQQQKVCATQRQWDVAELETQEAVRDRQSQSKWIPGDQ